MTEIQIPLEILNFQDNGSHLLVEVVVSGKAFKAVLDTGASKTAFDKELLAEILDERTFEPVERFSTGLGTNSMQCFKTMLPGFSFGKLEIAGYEVAVLDLSHINMAYKDLGHETILGVIGSDLLLEYNAVIDYEKQLLTLRKVKS